MAQKVSTGVAGLDELMAGGLPEGRVYLIRGEPGTGKTTMALQFLTAGAEADERGLYLTLSQTAEELRIIGESYGFPMTGFEVVDGTEVLQQRGRQTVLSAGGLELEQLLKHLEETLDQVKPKRFVIDALIDLRLRSVDVLAYRRMFRDFITMLSQADTTSIFLDSSPEYGGDTQVAGLVHGVLTLQRALPGYGIAQRRLEINKLRGVSHAEGLHDFSILASGVRVFPRLSSKLDAAPPSLDVVGTGLSALDEMLCGGLPQGTALMIYGQSGTGKSSLAGSIVGASHARGDESAAFLFEEHPKTFLERAQQLGMDLSVADRQGALNCWDMRAGEVLPGEFVHMVLDAADREKTRTVVIDSVNGYLTASANKDHALAQLNTLVATLRSRQVVTVLVVEQPGLLMQIGQSLDVSILSDCTILLRQYEAQSSIRRSIMVMKKRTGPHLVDVRELIMEPGAMRIEAISPDKLKDMRGSNLLSAQAPI